MCFKARFLALLMLFFTTLFSANSLAADSSVLLEPGDWDSFSRYVDTVERANENAGVAYMISGALVAIGGGIISHQSTDTLTNLTLGLIQSVGVAGIGYGAGLYYLSEPDETFRDTLLRQKDLTQLQRDEMTRNYLFLRKDREKRKRIISAITYGLIAALNTLNATQANDGNLKTVYWAVAGANLALSLSFTF